MADAHEAIQGVLAVGKGLASIDDRIKLTEAVSVLEGLEDENRRLAKENDDLRKELKRRKELEREGNAYYLLENDGSKTGPLCPKCYKDDGLVFALAKNSRGKVVCTVCGREYSGVKTELSTGGHGLQML